MFSTVIAHDGTKVQFKAGNDICRTYYIGDSVSFWVNPHEVGDVSFADDVYYGSDNAFVIVSWHKIVDVEFVSKEDYNSEYRNELLKAHRITEQYYRGLFTEEAWKRKESADAARQAELDAKRAQWKSEGLSDEQILAKIIVEPLSVSINYSEIGKKLLLP